MAFDFSRYDTRHYPTVSVQDGYAAWSGFYDAQMDGNMDLFLLDRVEGVDHFHREGGEAVAIRNHVHLLGDHVATGLARGWSLRGLLERVVDEEWVEANPSWSRHLHKPASFVLVWRKTTIV